MKASIIGAGGHGLDVWEIMRAAGWEFVAWFDDDPEKDCPAHHLASGPVIVGINDPHVRVALAAGYTPPPALIHPTVIIGGYASEIGDGSVLGPFVALTANVVVGRHTHINVGASVSQSSKVGDFCTVGPGARICGDVTIHNRVFIGAGAVISNLATIDHDATVGAGAVVLPGQHVAAGSTVVGVPARAVAA